MLYLRKCFLIAAVLFPTFSSHVCFSQSAPVPEYFGTYVNLEGHLLRLDGKTFNPAKTTTVRLADLKNENSFMAGQPGTVQPKDIQVPIFPANLKLVVYADDDPNTEFELESLLYVKNLTTFGANGGGIGQTFLVNGWDDSWNLAAVRRFSGLPSQDIELQYKPVSGQKNMIVAGLDEALPPGVYRLKREEGGLATSLMGSGGLIFAVEPLREGELGRCINMAVQLSNMGNVGPKYTPCSNSAASNASGTAPEEPSSTTNEDNSNIPTGAPAACSDYDSCFKAGLAGYQRADWSAASADFAAATQEQPTRGEAWYWLGVVLLRDGQPHQASELSRFWDKALSLGGSVTIPACHERAFQPCERGNLRLSAKLISFNSSGNSQLLSAAPNEIEPGRVLNNSLAGHISYGIKIDGKNYAFDFVPPGLDRECTFNLMVQCPADGLARQLLLAQYVSQTLPELVSGALK